jgi:glycosyltransferase involved in cell wall biosynthesis
MSTDPIRVLVYESYALGKKTGEVQTILYLLENLDRNWFKSILVLPLETCDIEERQRQDTEVITIEPPPRLQRYGGQLLKEGIIGRFRTFLDLFRYSRTLVRVIRSKRADVVYCCSLRALLIIGPAARITGRPILFFVNGELQNPLLDTFAYLLSNKVVFQCASNRDDKYPGLRRIFRRKLAVVPSGVDLTVIARARANPIATSDPSLPIESDHVNMMVLGLLRPEKGLDQLIDALALLRSELTDVRLHIVGDQLTKRFRKDSSSYRMQLQSRVKDHGLQGMVQFTGWRDDALRILASMDVLVHPSLSEGMPRAVLEAMALNKAVVATSTGCSRELIRHRENGLLVPPGDVNALAVAISEVVKSESLRESLGKAAAETIRVDYGIKDKIRQLEIHFSNLACR